MHLLLLPKLYQVEVSNVLKTHGIINNHNKRPYCANVMGRLTAFAVVMHELRM